MDGIARIRDTEQPGTWDAHERDGAVIVQVRDDDDAEPIAEFTLSKDDVIAMLVALEMADKEQEQPTTA